MFSIGLLSSFSSSRCATRGKLSTKWTNVTSNESWDTIGLPPILVVFDYHNDRSKPSLEQPSREGFLFMTRPHLDKGSQMASYSSNCCNSSVICWTSSGLP